MILDVFPSYKDKDMVDLLYQFERATGLSLNILVEKYLEKLLYEKGYLTVEIEDDSHEEDNGADEEKDERFVEDDDLKYIYKNLCDIVSFDMVEKYQVLSGFINNQKND